MGLVHLQHISRFQASPSGLREDVRQQEPNTRLPEIRPRKKQRTSKTLLVDNYDSYTYNLFQLISKVTGETPAVIRNDELSWRELSARISRGSFRSAVISPGPGTPLRPSDLGVCRMLLEEAEELPILGVCLGMQALAHVHGAQVVRASEPIHGRLSRVRHNQSSLFDGIPSGCRGDFEVVRYHSLTVREESLPPCLEPVAWTCGKHHAVALTEAKTEVSGLTEADSVQGDGDVVMGIAHKTRPHWGVQFHPESVATSYGPRLMQNFFSSVTAHHEARDYNPHSQVSDHSSGASVSVPERDLFHEACPAKAPAEVLDVRWRRLENSLDNFQGAETMFWHLYGRRGATNTFWLDSASMEGQRFSYMGGQGGPLWQRFQFQLANTSQQDRRLQPGSLTITNAEGRKETSTAHFLDFLEAQLKRQQSLEQEELPFEFTGGFVGYLGYEMKAECGSLGMHASPHPDAAMFFVDRLVVLDHATKDVFLVALHRSNNDGVSAAQEWLSQTESSLQQLTIDPVKSQSRSRPPRHTTPGPPEPNIATPGIEEASDSGNLHSRKTRQDYVADVKSCLEALRSGESYELCLTTQLRKSTAVQPWDFYRQLRASNPAAHAAWLSFDADLPTICCSSPERFLKGSAKGVVEARPIKGTARRYASPELDQQSKATLLSSAKARAENLMIVDLLRNDLGRVCEVGSVHVPGLMEVESYSTVHNLVSTVRGKRKQGSSVVDCLRACFPGGSMTGAPKQRSMDILERLEGGPRGVYSGCLGFIGLNNTFDLNIVIRTAVISDTEVTIGAGGAIVLQSDPEEEYEEMMLKASALLNAVDRCAL